MNAYYKIALISIAAALTSCAGDDAVKMDSNDDAKQLITIKVSDAKSRAGRELQNPEAGQNIENVKVLLVDNTNKVVWTKKLEKWNTNDAIGGSTLSDDKTYREATIEIPKDEYRLANGEVYHAYAYGYSNNSDYDMTPVESITVDNAYTPNLPISLKAGKLGEEIFAGDCELIGNVNGIDVRLVLNRQVAGAFGYLTKIPYVADANGHTGKYLILTASNPQSELILGEFDNSTSYETTKGKNIINAQKANGVTVIYTIKIEDWFNQIVEAKNEEGRGTGLIAGDDNWKGDDKNFRNGSVYGGNFLLPFAKVADTPTFKLSLCYDNDINTAMRTWNVLLPSTAAQLTKYSVMKYDGSAWATEDATDDETVYNVLRNRLYGIGVKAFIALDAGTPDDPTDDPEDDPLPINNKQELYITVNGEWSSIYNMGVE